MFVMHSRWLHIVLCCLVSCRLAAAVSADSINRAAKDEDFIRASLITVGPGNEIYSLYGHTAIRMQCPAHQLDYCFTFEMALKPEEELKFMFSTAKAGFIAAKSELFFDNYRAKGRGITEQQLNLRPEEEQQLWRMLDQEMARGAHWDYNFLTTNCSSMCIWIIGKALSTEGETIVYSRLPEPVKGTYRDLLDYISADAPWAYLFWNLRMGSKGSEMGAITDKLAPALLQEAWADACIKDSAAVTRPVFLGSPTMIAPQKLQIGTTVVTPMMALIILIIIIIIILMVIKRKTMKRFFTSSKRLVLTGALVLTSALSAMAAGEDWYAYNVQIDAYPTGAGLVYADENDIEAYAPAEDAVFKESVNVQYTSTSTMMTAFVQANEGWHFLGFAKDKIEENGDVVKVDSIVAVVDEWMGCAMLSIEGVGSKHIGEDGEEVSDDSLTVAGKMPLDPNNYFRALFTHAYVSVAPGYEDLAEVKIDKLVNNIGDKVTLTASTKCGFTTFVNWTKDGEVVSTEPTVEVTVGGEEEYVANFTDSRNVTINFPEEGGYLPFYSEYGYGLTNTGVSEFSPAFSSFMENDCLVDFIASDGARVSHLNMVEGTYQASGKTAHLLFGYGEQTLVPNDTVAADDPSNEQLFMFSGEAGVAVSELDQTNDKYYTFNQQELKFELITEGTIPANSLYLVMPDSLMAAGQPAPTVIYLDADSDPAGINNAKIDRNAQKRIYDLTGRQIDAINREGIYVFDGKKVIYRKK